MAVAAVVEDVEGAATPPPQPDIENRFIRESPVSCGTKRGMRAGALEGPYVAETLNDLLLGVDGGDVEERNC